ncbi:hypothetical protein OG216_05605 [Streptomycetaceae bacterium NBC_01309]
MAWTGCDCGDPEGWCGSCTWPGAFPPGVVKVTSADAKAPEWRGSC